MTMFGSNHPRRRFGRRELEPVCSEPELSSYTAEHFKRNAAAAKGNARAAGRMPYDSSADHIDWYGIGVDRSHPIFDGVDGADLHLPPAYLPRSEIYPRIAKDNRAYTVVSVALALVLGVAVASVAIAWFVRAKPVAIDSMPIAGKSGCVWLGGNEYRCD